MSQRVRNQLAAKARIVRRVNSLKSLAGVFHLNVETDPAFNILLTGKTEDVRHGISCMRILANVVSFRSLDFEDGTTCAFIS